MRSQIGRVSCTIVDGTLVGRTHGPRRSFSPRVQNRPRVARTEFFHRHRTGLTIDPVGQIEWAGGGRTGHFFEPPANLVRVDKFWPRPSPPVMASADPPRWPIGPTVDNFLCAQHAGTIGDLSPPGGRPSLIRPKIERVRCTVVIRVLDQKSPRSTIAGGFRLVWPTRGR